MDDGKYILLHWAENEVSLAIEDIEKHGQHLSGKDLLINQFREALRIYSVYSETGIREASTEPINYILEFLVNAIPLTDLTDNPYEWNRLPKLIPNTEVECYTNVRYPSLSKMVSPNGKIVYQDSRRITFHSIRNPCQSITDIFALQYLKEVKPITMPYAPPLYPYKMIGETFLTDPNNGDYDTAGYFYIKCPDDAMISVNRYFKIEGDTETEITNLEYNKRKEQEV